MAYPVSPLRPGDFRPMTKVRSGFESRLNHHELLISPKISVIRFRLKAVSSARRKRLFKITIIYERTYTVSCETLRM